MKSRTAFIQKSQIHNIVVQLQEVYRTDLFTTNEESMYRGTQKLAMKKDGVWVTKTEGLFIDNDQLYNSTKISIESLDNEHWNFYVNSLTNATEDFINGIIEHELNREGIFFNTHRLKDRIKVA